MPGTLTRVSASADEAVPGGADDDRSLAERVAAGDDRALAGLYDRHGTVCFTLALRVCANRALAEEAVQEAFLTFWRDRSFVGERGSVRSFLLALAHHKAVDLVRRESARARREGTYAAREPVADDGGVGTGIARAEDAGAVRAALDALPPAQRDVLVLAYFRGLTQREIAEETGIPLGTVKTRMFAGMRRLQLELSPPAAPEEEIS